tara:strand:- start:3140 stop:3727 length:588 start_codon:yes stop_codon:yes gene_type:complete
MTTLFITEDKLKSFSGIDENVDPNTLYPYVLQSQEIYLQTTLGTKLYDAITNYIIDYVTNGTPIPTAYKTLLDDYIVNMLVYYAYYLALPHIKYKTTNKGLLSGTSEVGESVSLEEVQFLMNQVNTTAQFYNERLRDYLKAYSNDYPEYQSYTNKDGMAPRKGTSYYTGLAMDSKLNTYCDDCEDSEGRANYPIY